MLGSATYLDQTTESGVSMKKRIISIFLCIILCVSCLPICAFSTDEEVAAEVSSEIQTDAGEKEEPVAYDLEEVPSTPAADPKPKEDQTASGTSDATETGTPSEPKNDGEDNTGILPAEDPSDPAGETTELLPDNGGDDTLDSGSGEQGTNGQTEEGTSNQGDSQNSENTDLTDVAVSETENTESAEQTATETGATAATGTQSEKTEEKTSSSDKEQDKEKEDKKTENKETEEEEITETITLDNIVAGDSNDNEELLNKYAEQLIENELPRRAAMKAAKNVGSNLKGINRTIYNTLRAGIEQTAEGSRTSTKYAVDLSSFGLQYDASELGYTSITDSNKDAATSKAITKSGMKLMQVLEALLADCPYELYWFDKVTGVKPDYSITRTKSYIRIDGVTLCFTVADEYAAGTYKLDTSCISTVNKAINKAKSIVSSASGLTDLEKLERYRSQICSLTNYNTDAAEGFYDYGNPWQLIWVFDGNSSTKVVCEGYAKAFQYLCDLTSFNYSLITCYTVTGEMSSNVSYGSEGHMWNLVTMDDGKNYLVDVTNCDAGSIGAPTKLFLQGYDSGSLSDGYRIKFGSYWVEYSYDSYTRSIFSNSDLTLPKYDYEDPSHIHEEASPVKENVVKATYLSAGSYEEVVYCKLCGRELSRIKKTVKKLSLDTPTLKSISAVYGKITLKWAAVDKAQKYRVFRKTGSGSWTRVADTTNLSYVDKSVKPGTKYTYTVRCMSRDGSYYMSSYDKTGKTATAVFKLSNPVLVSAKNTTAGVRVKWNSVSGAEKYRVFRKVSGGSWKKLADVTTLSCTDATAKIGTTYVYTVRCISSDGRTYLSSYDAAGKTVKAAYVLTAPVLKSAVSSSGTVTVKWSAVDGAEKYRVFRKEDGGKWVSLANVTSLKYVDKTAEKGTTYVYTVRCVSSDGKRFTSSYDKAGISVFCK